MVIGPGLTIVAEENIDARYRLVYDLFLGNRESKSESEHLGPIFIMGTLLD